MCTEAEPDVVVTTRVPVAGSYDRSFTEKELAECWTCAASALNLSFRCGTSELSLDTREHLSQRLSVESTKHHESNSHISSIASEDSQKNGEFLEVLSVESIQGAICTAAAALERRHWESDLELIVCVAGSLHAVAATLTLIQDKHIEQ